MNHKYLVASNVMKVTPKLHRICPPVQISVQTQCWIGSNQTDVFHALQCLQPHIHQQRAINPLNANWFELGKWTAKYGIWILNKLCMCIKSNCTIHIENPTRCYSVPKFYFIFIWSSTCFGLHTAHHQEPKTALAASGFACMEDCWTCSCWTLTASRNYTSNNLPRMQNHRLLVQF